MTLKTHLLVVSVDENLFYKGVDKKMVHGARLHQSHSVAEPAYPPLSLGEEPFDKEDNADLDEVDENKGQPPYPFDTGNSLLALTKKHNVNSLSFSFMQTLFTFLS